jgi:uncharacterized protein involved in exopolysaccharide biosynthesis
LQSQLDSIQDAINRAGQQRMFLTSSLDSAEASQAAIAQFAAQTDVMRSTTPAGVAPAQARRAALSEQLLRLRQRYKAEHPDVQALTREIQALERAERDEPVTDPSVEKSTINAIPLKSPEFVQSILRERERVESLRTQIAANDKWLATLHSERTAALERIDGVRSRIASLPMREQELVAVTREYDISKRNYQSLLDKKLSAAMGAEMERRQQSERFTILDPARVPEMPVKPRRVMIIGSAAALGLAFAVAAAFLVESRGNTLSGEWEIPGGVAILGCVPDLANPRVSPFRVLGWAAACGSLLFVGVLTTLYHVGRIRPEGIVLRLLQ